MTDESDIPALIFMRENMPVVLSLVAGLNKG